MTREPEAAFLLRRAEEEAILALRADHALAADSHRELSVRYAARARKALSAEQEGTFLMKNPESEAPGQCQGRLELVSVLLAALRCG
jgi:hypothetical protein